MKIPYNALILFLLIPSFPSFIEGKLIFIYSLLIPIFVFLKNRSNKYYFSIYVLSLLLFNFIWPFLISSLSLNNQSSAFIFTSFKEINLLLWYFLGNIYSYEFHLNKHLKQIDIFKIIFKPLAIYLSFSLIGGYLFPNQIKSYFSSHPTMVNLSFPEYLHYNLSSTAIFLYLLSSLTYLVIKKYYANFNFKFSKLKFYKSLEIAFDLITLVLIILCFLTFTSALPIIVPSILLINICIKISSTREHNFYFWNILLFASTIFIIFFDKLIPYFVKILSLDMDSLGKLTVILNSIDNPSIFNIIYGLLNRVLSGANYDRFNEITNFLQDSDLLKLMFGVGVDNNNFVNMDETLFSFCLIRFGIIGCSILIFLGYKIIAKFPLKVSFIIFLTIFMTSFSSPAIFAPKSGPVFWFIIGFISNKKMLSKYLNNEVKAK